MGLGCMFGHIFHGSRGHNKERSSRNHPDIIYGDQDIDINKEDQGLKTLKLRFVNGEISEEEYKRMKQVLIEN